MISILLWVDIISDIIQSILTPSLVTNNWPVVHYCGYDHDSRCLATINDYSEVLRVWLIVTNFQLTYSKSYG